MPTNDDDLVIDRIEACRRKNNHAWMDLLRLARRAAPDEARQILKRINENDRKISELLGRLADEADQT